MAQKDLYAGRDAPRQRAWDRIRERADSFTIGDVAASDMSYRTVKDYVGCLLAAGIIEKLEEAARFGKSARYGLVQDRGHEAPRVNASGATVTRGSGREQMWRTMKMLGQFTAAELAMNATTEEVAVSHEDALSYAKHLAKAGYLAVISMPKKGTKERARYQFVPARNSGPQPPSVQMICAVFDRNENRIVWHDPVTI